MASRFLCTFVLGATLLSCGADKPAKKPVDLSRFANQVRHDYSSTWVYAVGEVDSPSATDCQKAFGHINGDTECVGKACQHALDLVKDFEFACGKTSGATERAQVGTLKPVYASRVTEPMTSCVEKAEDWLARGCGSNGDCESKVQRWATQCTESTQSKLVIFLLERMIENSLTEPRRVKLDARSCHEFAKSLEAGAQCSKPFDCEDALPRIDEYLLRCAQGSRKAVPLTAALGIVKIRMGAEKPFEPIALTDEKTTRIALPGTLALVDGSGVVARVCDEPPATDLPQYLEQRQRCTNGTLTLIRASGEPSKRELVQISVPHDSDEAFAASYPKLWVPGEAEARSEAALTSFVDAMRTLPERALEDFTGAIANVNRAFAKVPPSLRQGTKLRDALAPHDASLAILFGIVADAKVRMAGSRMTDVDLLAYLRRSESLVFADVNASGSVEIGATIELSELLAKDTLPVAFAAYLKNLEKLRKQFEKRKATIEPDLAQARALIMEETRSCSAARAEYSEQQKRLEGCIGVEEGCEAPTRTELFTKLTKAQSRWGEARARELIAKLSAGQPTAPSAVCSRL
ncbi:MAG: hypothetical protein QM784_24870 [Polyangiaceae bacterium]